MKQTVLPVVFGVLAIAIISIAWAFPNPNAQEKAPPVAKPYAGTALQASVLRTADGSILAVIGQVEALEPVAPTLAQEMPLSQK